MHLILDFNIDVKHPIIDFNINEKNVHVLIDKVKNQRSLRKDTKSIY